MVDIPAAAKRIVAIDIRIASAAIEQKQRDAHNAARRAKRHTNKKRKYYGDQPSRLSLTERIEQIARRDMATLAPTQAA